MNLNLLFFLTWISNLAVGLAIGMFVRVPVSYLVIQPALAGAIAVCLVKNWRNHEKASQS